MSSDVESDVNSNTYSEISGDITVPIFAVMMLHRLLNCSNLVIDAYSATQPPLRKY